LNPSKFRATVVPTSMAEIQCSAEFGVFDATVDPHAVLALLQHPQVRAQIAPLGRGTSSSRRRIESADVIHLVAPPFDDSWVAKTGEIVAAALEETANARTRLLSAYASPGI